jgi:hypothetical protein
MALGLLLGPGCTTATTVEDAGSSSTGGTTTGATTTGGTTGTTTGGGTTSGGGSTSGGTTGGGPDLSCLGVPLPTTAPAMLNLGGTVLSQSQTGSAPVVGATVDMFQSGGGTSIATATTDANGLFTMTVPSGGAPLDAYFHVTASGFVDTYWYPPVPFFFDSTNAPVAMLTPTILGFLESFGGATQQAGNGLSALEVLDCTGHPISGAVVTSSPAAGKTSYFSGMFPSSTATATDSNGTAFLFNLTAGPVAIGAKLGTTTLRSHSVEMRADVVTETSVVP